MTTSRIAPKPTPRALAARLHVLALAMSAAAAHAADDTPPLPDSATTTLPAVKVQSARPGTAETAYRAGHAGLGALGDKELRNTPFTVEVFTRELIENKQATSLADVVKGDASATVSTNGINGLSTELIVRGSAVDFYSAYRIDGLSMLGWGAELPLEHYENIEFLKGAGGFLYGFGAPGAIVNYISKRPTLLPTRAVSAQVTDSGTLLLHGDVGGRFGADNRFGYRVNLVNEQGDTYVNDGGSIKRRSASVALDWRLTNDLVWSVDALHLDRKVNAAYYGMLPEGVGALAAPPAAIPGDRRVASSFGYLQSRSTTVGTELAWAFAPQWNARLAARRWEQDRTPHYSLLFVQGDGAYREFALSVPGLARTSQLQAIVTGHLRTGPVAHDLVIGASHSKTRVAESADFQGGEIGTGNLANPGNFPDPGFDASWQDGGYLYRERQRAVFVSDTLHFGSAWDLIIGLRNNQFESGPYDRTALTPTLAVVYRPLQWLSTYASYVESLEKGAEVGAPYANAGASFPPAKSKQAEVGVKAEGDHWSANLALFRMLRPLSYVTGTPGALEFTQDGESRFDGIELSGKARLDRQWTLTGSALALDAKNRKTSGGALDGKRTTGSPRGQVSGYVEYQFGGSPLVLTGGGRYTTARPYDEQNAFSLPAYALVDLGVRYASRWGGVDTTWRLNIDNVTDKAYWLGDGSRIVQGAPRTIKLGATVRF